MWSKVHLPLLGLLLLGAWVDQLSAARILGLFPYRGASHFYAFQPLMEGLAERGHQVTVVSHLPRKEPLKNYKDISVADPEQPTTHFDKVTNYAMSSMFYDNVQGLHYLAREYKKIISKPQLLALANSTFDVVIMEMFNSDLFFGLTYRIGAPVIGFSSCTLMPWTADSLGVPNLPAYLPNNLADHGPRLDWFERVVNTLEVWASRIYYRLVVHTEEQALAEALFGPLPDLAEIAANTSLLFINTHFTVLGQRPYPPSVVEVGGISVSPPKPLPKELDKMLNDSAGVIYFSLGSVLLGSSVPKKLQDIFTKVFSSYGQTVLWKREDNQTAVSANIVTRPWFPQRDILAHRKVDLFISHCGLLSLNEAVISGVPLLCIPFYGDQPLNAKYVKEAGFGLHLDFLRLTEDKLKSAISEILRNKKYKQRVVEISAAFRDRPMPPLETAIFWTEYLLRHGNKVFEAPFKGIPVWQREGLDIQVAIVALIGLVLSLAVLVLRVLVRLCQAKPAQQGSKKNAPKKKQN